MKKVFLLAGEVSGDKLGAWYIENLKKKQEEEIFDFYGIGGELLKNSGVKLYDKIENLNFVGLWEIIKNLKFILNYLKNLSKYIIDNNFEQIVLIDFPGFNLRLAKKLKKLKPDLEIIYLCPPQVWIWGQGRIKNLKKYFDKFIVIYPFEVDFYKSKGLHVEYLGNPVYQDINLEFKHIDLNLKNNNLVAILPGSRKSEINKLIHIFVGVIKKIYLNNKYINFVIPVSQNFDNNYIKNKLEKAGLDKSFINNNIKFVTDKNKLKELSKCCLAITKPGTISLELALLRIPAIVIYKTDFLTYLIARIVIDKKIKYMSLANLLLGQEIYKEFIQGSCKIEEIFDHFKILYKSILAKNLVYLDFQNKFDKLNKLFI